MSPVKEPAYFADDRAFANGVTSYAELFGSPEAATARYRGESSTAYMLFPRAVERIRSTLGEPRLIFVLRNPIDRVWSHYRWLVALGNERRPLRPAFLADLDHEPDFGSSIKGNFRYYGCESRYATHLTRFVDAFGRPRILVITAEELRERPEQTLRRCTDFLGLAPLQSVPQRSENVTPPARWGRAFTLISGDQSSSAVVNRLNRVLAPARARLMAAGPAARIRDSALRRLADSDSIRLDDEDRTWLRDFFVDEVARLRELTGMAFDEWSADFPLRSLKAESGAG
jgi:hypothetical protein